MSAKIGVLISYDVSDDEAGLVTSALKDMGYTSEIKIINDSKKLPESTLFYLGNKTPHQAIGDLREVIAKINIQNKVQMLSNIAVELTYKNWV